MNRIQPVAVVLAAGALALAGCVPASRTGPAIRGAAEQGATVDLSVTSRGWHVRLPMLSARYSAVAAAIGNTVYLFGGDDGAGPRADFEAYSADTNVWVKMADMPYARRGAAAGVVAGQLAVTAGYGHGSTGTVPLATTDLYDPLSGTWAVLPDLPLARFDVAYATTSKGLYVIGGHAGNTPVADVDILDANSLTWFSAPPLPFAIYRAAAVAVGDTVHLFGGRDASGTNGAWHFVLDPQANAWVVASPLAFWRYGTGAVARDGGLYVLGGASHPKFFADVERVLDPESGGGVVLSALPSARERFAAVHLPGRGTYVFGGRDANGPMAAVEKLL